MRGSPLLPISLALVFLTLACPVASGETTLPCIFADHMVLQRSDRTPIWGKADAGQRITVSVGGQTAETKAAPDGRWQIDLDLHERTGGPYTLVIEAGKTFTFSDVLVGEVWFASGQSNMEFLLENATGAQEEIEHSANPQLRQFFVPNTGALEPSDTCKGHWSIAAPETSGHFTAVGYYFAKELQTELHVPVALIHASQGASSIEAWMSQDGLERVPALLPSAHTQMENARLYPSRWARYKLDYTQWQSVWHREDPPVDLDRYAADNADTLGWRSVNVTGKFEEPSLPYGGVVWLRKTIEIKPKMAGVPFSMHLGELRDTDHVYVNGVEVGRTTATGGAYQQSDRENADHSRKYHVSGSLLKTGTATIAIRLFDPVGPPSIRGLAGDEPESAGPWLVKTAYTEAPIDQQALASFPRSPVVPADHRYVATELFNAMVHPLIPYAIRGVIWYQGEHNIHRAWQYRESFPALIKDWRMQWDQAKLPFYFCQIANFTAKTNTPKDAIRAELRDAQSSALSLPDTAEAMTFDVGEEANIHPRDKKTVGHRLALIALSRDYGKNVVYSGPMYQSSERDGASIRIHFTSTGEGLKAVPLPATYELNSSSKVVAPLVRNSPQSQLEGFQLCGPDHRWVWADAKIEGNAVVVSSPQIAAPVAVRYGWAENPTVNLYNSAGLPAGPFRTDDFPLSTRDAHY